MDNDADDDEDESDIGEDDSMNDRTHKIQLGGKLKICSIKNVKNLLRTQIVWDSVLRKLQSVDYYL